MLVSTRTLHIYSNMCCGFIGNIQASSYLCNSQGNLIYQFLQLQNIIEYLSVTPKIYRVLGTTVIYTGINFILCLVWYHATNCMYCQSEYIIFTPNINAPSLWHSCHHCMQPPLSGILANTAQPLRMKSIRGSGCKVRKMNFPLFYFEVVIFLN